MQEKTDFTFQAFNEPLFHNLFNTVDNYLEFQAHLISIKFLKMSICEWLG